MCLPYGMQCIQEQPDACSDVEPILVTVAVNMVALNILENQKRLAGQGHTCVNQFRYVGMCQATQNAAFAREPLFAALPHQREIENFHRYAPLKSSVVSFRQPDGAHSPIADLRNQGVDTQSL